MKFRVYSWFMHLSYHASLKIGKFSCELGVGLYKLGFIPQSGSILSRARIKIAQLFGKMAQR